MSVNRVRGNNDPNRIDEDFADDPDGNTVDGGDTPDDLIEALAGADTVFSGEGDDTVYAGADNDFASGETGNDLIFGDSAGPGLALRFESEDTRFQNVVGVYEIDPETGAISNVRIAFENASAPGSGGNLAPGTSVNLTVSPGAQLGVFLVADGFNRNDIGAIRQEIDNDDGTLAFVDRAGNPAGVGTPDPQLVLVDTDGIRTPLDGSTVHSAGFGGTAGLNPDGAVKTEIVAATGTDSVTFGIDDVVLTVELTGEDTRFAVADRRDGTVTEITGAPATGAGAGNDTLLGGTGDDTIFGEGGNDLVDGGFGDDRMSGGPGNDRLFGRGGDDRISGGDGNDTLFGGAGDDTIALGSGRNAAFGNADRDTFTGFDATSENVVFGGTSGEDFDTLDLRGSVPDGGSFSIEDLKEDDGSFEGTVIFSDADGAETGEIDFEEIENIIPCFTPGTRIATPRGEVAVEALRAGDRVITRDNGLQEVRWVGARALDAAEVTAAPHLCPVLIRAGALGRGLPERDMLVSPQHRVLLTSERAALYFGEREVLAAATHLTGMAGIDAMQPMGVRYIHFMCDRHEVVLSDGAWTESFQPGEQVLDGMGAAARDEIVALFPALRDRAGIEAYQAARRALRRHEARLLVK